MKKLSICILFACLFGSISAQKHEVNERPRLVVTIAIDGLRSDYLTMLWNGLSEGGFRRLINDGSYCRNMNYPYRNVGNAADYASVYSGSMPADHSICGDTYWEPASNRYYSYLYDKERKGIGTDVKISPVNFLSSTFVDELKLNTMGKAKVITIAINANEAVIMAGHGGNATVWIDDRQGTWASTNYYTSLLPQWASKMNSENPAQENVNRNWTNLYIGSQYKTISAQNQASAFFAHPFESSNKDYPFERLKQSPVANTMVKDLALAALKDDYIGIDETPDMLNLQFTVRGFNQASTGVLTAETEDLYLRVDQDLAELIDAINKKCGNSNVMYVVYAPQSEYVSPDFLKMYGIPSGYFVADRSLALLNSHLMATYGQGDFIHSYANHQLFLNKSEIEKRNLNVQEVTRKISDFMVRFQGVQMAFTAEEMDRVDCSNDRMQQIRNSYNRAHGGDIILYMQPGWVSVPNESVKVGLSTRINNHAPFIISGWKVKRQLIKQAFSALDIAPTICNILHLNYPDANLGQALQDIVE
ncbi:MAG: alkaline phosphatase family protein [Prevotellaceae bacterium]|jgi:hypothetical protein|nr:alkaline phosphatase family protein [Prevotellaceae bacterium]